MTTLLRPSMLAATLCVLATGCLHHRTTVPCAAAPGESACWESARSDRGGRLEHHVVERVTEGERCDTAVVEQTSFVDGKVLERVKDTRRCGVVDHRITDRYDLQRGRLVREVAEDLDHDDHFDTVRTYDVALSPGQRLFAMTTGWQRWVRLHERMPQEAAGASGMLARVK